MKTVQDKAFLRRIKLSLILCSMIVLFDFALSESTWRTVRSQKPRLPDADRVRHCMRQTPEISVLQYYCSAISGILVHFETLMSKR